VAPLAGDGRAVRGRPGPPAASARAAGDGAGPRSCQTGPVPGGALLTDLYELNMAASYLELGMTAPATFSCFVRRMPPGRGYTVAAGLEDVLAYLETLAFGEDELAALERLGYPPRSLERFARLRFTGEVLAAPEGTILGENEPLLEITAPLPEAQLVETFVLNQLTYQSAVASKAARCRVAAAGLIDLVEFGLRRAHGAEAGMAASRAAAIAGFVATSNVAAATTYGVRAAGTMAHAYVEAFESELEAFLAFGAEYPERATFLVDTYDTLEGVGHAAEAIRRLGLAKQAAIRIDSGDLAALAAAARRRLDEEDLASVRIFASGNLDEHAIAALVAAGAPVDAAGVGTRLATSADAPFLESVYKLVAYAGRPVAKRSSGKASLPGAKQVYRSPGCRDLLALRDELPAGEGRPLLEPVMRGGRRLAPAASPVASVQLARERFEADLAELAPEVARIESPEPLVPRLSAELRALTETVWRRPGSDEALPA